MTGSPDPWLQIYQAAAARYGIPANVLEGQDYIESTFNPAALSPTGAGGISQFEPTTAASYGVHFGTSPADVRSQIMGQAAYLKALGYAQDPSLALSKYNAGPNNPSAAGPYAANVLAAAKRYVQDNNGTPTASSGGGNHSLASLGVAPVPTGTPVPTSSGASTTPNIFDILGGLDTERQNLMSPQQGQQESPIQMGIQNGWDLLSSLVRGQQSPEAQSQWSPPSVVGGNGGSGSVTLPSVPGTGDVDPLRHFNIGRTDMGVDATAAPGTPIVAPNDSKVIHVYPNWFQGQPYLLLQFVKGPNTGKYYYVAEQITSLARPGTIVRRGQPIARYAGSGTGIEIGWGTPTESTRAQATTGYTEGQVTQAGSSFRNYLRSLGVK